MGAESDGVLPEGDAGLPGAPASKEENEHVPDEDKQQTAAGSSISESSRGKRIAVLTHGTRGDVQPFVALSAHLQASGFVVLVTTNQDHVNFFEKFGLDARGVKYPMEPELYRPDVQEAMGKGDTIEVYKLIGKTEADHWQESTRRLWLAVRDFGPDLVLATPLEEFNSRLFAHLLGVPCIGSALQHKWPTSELPTLLGETHFHKFVWGQVVKGGYDLLVKHLPQVEALFAEELAQSEELIMCRTYESYLLDYMSPTEPYLLAVSELMMPRPRDWPRSLDPVCFTGFWVVGREEQERRLRGKDGMFGGEALAPLTEFLSRGAPPVYMGWGSMVANSAEHMTCLAVRSLRRAGLRGVILGGWAKLSAAMVRGQPDAAELEAYIGGSVLFLDSAPHEWLFPRCALTVHHGGAGTTAAALRSGVPTVITPCFSDQFSHGTIVQRTGAGLRLKQFGKVTVNELGDAIARCAADESIRGAAARLGERLRAEDGLEAATKVIDRFLSEDVATGAWAQRREARMREHERIFARQRRCCRCR
mmetsp:Transcript_81158/g.224611  ORF Transcript_81158/g.224611 Transcript_81158/m.224611 type:complete len:534 (-) Transcript_81158:151-1752(-)